MDLLLTGSDTRAGESSQDGSHSSLSIQFTPASGLTQQSDSTATSTGHSQPHVDQNNGSDRSNPTGTAAAGGGGGGRQHSDRRSATTDAPVAPPVKIRRRNRMITSCLECRRRKLKCDRLHPCGNCAKFKRQCIFLAPTTDALSRMKLMELKEKMGSLELVLEQDVAAKQSSGQNKKNDGPAVAATAATSSTDGTDFSSQPVPTTIQHFDSRNFDEIVDNAEPDRSVIPDDERDLKPSPLAVMDAGYDDDLEDDTLDLGVRFGKIRVTDRIGGYVRPRAADELTSILNRNASDGCLASSLPGVTGNVLTGKSPPPKITPEILEAYFKPGPLYIAPSSGLFFGGGSQRHSLVDFLPTKMAADRLMEQYWYAVHPIAKILHRQTFERKYTQFWSDVTKGLEPPFSLQALVFAALFTAVVSMPEASVLSTFGVPQRKLIENFQFGTEMALGKANFLKTSSIQVLHALVMYMIPMVRYEVSRAHSVLVGTAIRLAECLGIHRDPEEYGHGPVETHIRRMIWYQLCFLDLRTSEFQGPRHAIRREDFSTRFPLNVDDLHLAPPAVGPLSDLPAWTDITLTRIRFECNELLRLMSTERTRLDKGTVTITHVLGKIEAFRKAAYGKYGPLIYVPNPQPIQRVAQLVLSILLCRAYISVVHRYHNSTTVRIPDRLRQIIITTGAQLLEDAMTLETTPELQPWAWYASSFSLYHISLVLLVEVWSFPMRREADRIWRCLDFIFETPPTPPLAGCLGQGSNHHEVILQREAKARSLITQLRDRIETYREMRRLRIPLSMTENDLSTTPAEWLTREPSSTPSGRSSNHSEAHSSAPVGLRVSPSVSSLQPSSYHSQPHPQPSPQLQELQQNQQQQFQTQDQFAWQPPPYNQPHLHQTYQSQVNHPQSHMQSYTGSNNNTQPSSYLSAYEDHDRHRRSVSSTAGSDDSGNLWFLPGAPRPSAGAAPPSNSSGAQDPQKNDGDLPMLDIDWNEWDKIFPPNINNGDLNFPDVPPVSMDHL